MTRTILMNSWKMVDGLRLAPRMPTIPKRSILLNHYQCLEFITLFLPRRTTYYLFSVDSVWTISSSENNSFIVDIYVNDSKEQQKKRLHFKNHKSNCHTNRSGQKKSEPASCNVRIENTTRILLLPNAIYISIKTYAMFSVFPLDFVYYNKMLRFALYLFH